MTDFSTFAELELLAPIQKALVAEKYITPTPIQAQTIPHLLAGLDVLGCAQTGTGKTAAFALPILHQLGSKNQKAQPNHPRALVLAPTRELAVQIGESFATYGRHLHIRHTVVYGGVGQQPQVRALSRGVHLLIATPGRLLDLMNQGHIRLDRLETFVLDEADRMLDMGFLPDLKRIISALPKERQSLFFSATMPKNIVELSQQLLTNPVRVTIAPDTTRRELIDQRVVFIDRGKKRDLLQKILSGADVGSTLVFTRTKRGASDLAERLCKNGIKADAIHGNKSQSARQRSLNAFKSSRIKVLVATDVAARGIDVDGVTHVVNYEIPNEPENYVHRIGRTGRAGASGMAVSLCDHTERRDFQAIERHLGQSVALHEQFESCPSIAAPPSGGGGGKPSGGNNRRFNKGRRPAASRGNGGVSGNAVPGSGRPARNGSSQGGSSQGGSSKGPRKFGKKPFKKAGTRAKV